MDEDNVDDGDRHPDLDQDASASQNRNELETNSAVNSVDEGVGMGAGAWDEAWDEEKDSDEDESESELDDQERHTLQREDQQTVTSLTEDEDEYKEMEALLAAEECRFEPPWPLVNDSVNRNEDEPDEDLPEAPEARRPFRLQGGYEEPLKNDPFFVKFPGMAGHAISNDTKWTLVIPLQRTPIQLI